MSFYSRKLQTLDLWKVIKATTGDLNDAISPTSHGPFEHELRKKDCKDNTNDNWDGSRQNVQGFQFGHESQL